MRPIRWTESDDFRWFVAAGLGGALAVGIASLGAFTRTTDRLWCMAAGLFLVGFLVSLYRPDQSWRWGLAAAIAPALSPLLTYRSVESVFVVFLLALFALASLLGAALASTARLGCEAFLPRDFFGPTLSRQAGVVVWPIFWAVGLGAVGFVAGFLGPGFLGTGGNQGPLVGILITGPLGAAGGFAAGLLLSLLRRWRTPEMVLAFLVAANLYLGWMLWRASLAEG